MSLPVLCDVVDRCGGCPWLASSAEDEWNHKLSQLHNLVASLGVTQADVQFRAAATRVGYRNRIRLRIDERGTIAFFNSGKSSACAVLEPKLRDFVSRLRDWSHAHPGSLARFAHLEARAPDGDGNAGLFLTHRADATHDIDLAQRLASDAGSALVATDRDATVPHQHLPHFGGTWLCAPLNGFIQINSAVNASLIEEVLRGTLECGCRTFADLFAGAGNFAVPLAHAGLSGLLVEYDAGSVRAAQCCASQQKLDRLTCQAGDAIAAARQCIASNSAFDLVIVDPPRAGIRDGLDIVARLARRAIAYCSCNLQTLQRDLNALIALDWSLKRVTGFDMFPGTQHVEALAWLVPQNPGSGA